MVTPFLVLLMPVVGQFMSSIWFHVVIVFLIIPTAVWALWNGYREHKEKRVLYFGGIGIFLIVVAMSFGVDEGWFEIATMTAAGIFLVAAHAFNLKACRLTHS